MRSAPLFSLLALGLALSLTGCGGGGSSSSSSSNSNSTDTSTTNSTTTTVSGNAVAGAVAGNVTVTDGTGTLVAAGKVTSGAFSVDVPDSALSGELDFVVTGSYTDEVSGNTVLLDATGPLALHLAAGAVTSGTAKVVGITPETTVVRQLVKKSGMTLANARAAYKAALGNDPDGSADVFDPTAAAPTGVTTAIKENAFRSGAYSQWVNDLTIPAANMGAFPTALAADLADGVLDGLDGTGTPVTVGGVDLKAAHAHSPLAAQYLTAMATFSGSAKNVAKVTAPAAGLPDNAKITETITNMTKAVRTVTLADGTPVKIEVSLANAASIFSNMQPATARTVYRVTLTDMNTNLPIDITAPTAKVTNVTAGSLMHMLSGMSHGTPMMLDVATSVAASGQYDFSVYYVMASAMAGGMPMGLWDFSITLDDNVTPTANKYSVMFHPNVGMVMGTSVLSQKGTDSSDMAMSMTGTSSPRPYWVWLDSVATNVGGGHDIQLFVSSKVSMKFISAYANMPKVTSGMDSLQIGAMTVEISTDDITYTAMTDLGNGRFTATNFAGLAAGTANNLWVRVTAAHKDAGGADVITVVKVSGANYKLTFPAP